MLFFIDNVKGEGGSIVFPSLIHPLDITTPVLG